MSQAAYLAQQALNTCQIALLYALIALAYVLFHGVTNRFNLAFGALVTWGSYLALAAFSGGLSRRGVPDIALAALAIAIAVAGAAALGHGVGRTLRPLLVAPPLAILVATLGWGIALEEAARISAGSRELWLRPLLGGPAVSFAVGAAPMRITLMQGLVWAAAALAIAATLVSMRLSAFGRAWRAVSQDARMAALVGVDIGRVYAVTVLFASALAGTAGALAGLAYGNASFHGALIVATKALFVAILGGLHSPAGAILGALLLAAMESLWSAYLPGDWRDVAVFVVLAALVVHRPRRSSADRV
ncbi:ABC transporter permease subunit [Lutibaculum baratangense]|uniref:ABC transporter, permease protein n=1 Tax=Lutibaculum baratangense AMV1 TaxID=631454 RepID=V4RPZ9_9HYPH|nr:ABC transporter permease [Lutibaculum baratangense]ESR27349.1 ABC transporter, permease protein [Lutibaculum baratangense AMV1]